MSNPIFKFEKAQRIACKASIQIEGLTGLGKSGLALILGHGLSGNDWSKVFHIDTENKSANLFVGIPSSIGGTFGEFNVGQLTPEIGFKPSNYLAFREAAIQAGATVVIKDSISHAWQYKGGILDLVAQAKTKSAHYSKDQYAAWGDEEVVKEKNELLQLIRDPRCHVITTVRVKEKMEYGTDENGKTKLMSMGEQQIQQAELKYEPDLVLHMVKPGSETNHPVARVVKTRYAILKKDEEYEFTPELISQLKAYLEEGVDPATIFEQQRQEYIKAVTDYLNTKPSAKAIWTVMKTDAGHKETKLGDLPLEVIKGLFIKLTN